MQQIYKRYPIPKTWWNYTRVREATRHEKKILEMLINRSIWFIHVLNKPYNFVLYKPKHRDFRLSYDQDTYHKTHIPCAVIYCNENAPTSPSVIINGYECKVLIYNELELLFKDILRIYGSDYDKIISKIFDRCRSTKFPYISESLHRLRNIYMQLCEISTSNIVHTTTTGYHIIKHFHKSIYHAHYKDSISPYDAWNDDAILTNVIKNRFIYCGKLDPSSILNGFNITKSATKVSVFRPALAKKLINTYLGTERVIFDPFSGFSGRMLGCCATGRQYIGQDINSCHVHESNKIIEFLNLNATVIQQDILVDETKEYESLFTCSPYTDKEQWNQETVYKSCDEWIDICMEKYKCKKYLFVVDETTKYKDYIVEEIINKSHFGSNKEYVILISK